MKQARGEAKAGVVAIALAALMLFVLATTMAGNLEPGAPPASTMKTLDQIPPTWSQILPADDGPDSCSSSRFECVMSGEAVLDKETGLVWSRDADPANGNMIWDDAVNYPRDLVIGGRKGWRLPTVEELSSLIDTTESDPALPNGHPFTDIATGWYWSSTTREGQTTAAWHLIVFNGTVGTSGKGGALYAWPVRGGK
jgi:hypothetical protein